jgi:large subunit ribosomal protein L21
MAKPNRNGVIHTFGKESPVPSTATPRPPSFSTESTHSLINSRLLNMKHDGKCYAIVELANRPLLVTKNDVVIVNRLKSVSIGDVLDLTKVREVGTMHHKLKGAPYVNENLVKVQATVLEHPRGEKCVIVKKKRRKNYQRKIGHRQELTVLRIGEVALNV